MHRNNVISCWCKETVLRTQIFSDYSVESWSTEIVLIQVSHFSNEVWIHNLLKYSLPFTFTLDSQLCC